MAGPVLVQGMDKERLEQLNLSVLQRIDPETEQVCRQYNLLYGVLQLLLLLSR